MVRAPVGEGAAAVLGPVAEAEMAALGDVFSLRSRALPGVPVKPLRYWGGLERPGVETLWQSDRDGRQLPEPAVANDLAGQPEPRVAPLLASSLEHPPVLPDS